VTTDPTVILVDQFVAHPAARVWEALTDPDQVSEYFMDTDLRPEVGASFTFTRRRVRPELREGRTIHCRVLEVRPEAVLAYSWADTEFADGLDSVVTWTLHPEGSGTRILLEHRGFDPADPVSQQLRDVMREGWGRLLHQLLVDHLAVRPGAVAG
jgi:uncharacterized protein YndB with AHSA1/START domain